MNKYLNLSFCEKYVKENNINEFGSNLASVILFMENKDFVKF